MASTSAENTAPTGEAILSNQDGASYLTGLIGKTLRIQISDRRMFVGALKCTDRDRNIILDHAHEYREPTQAALEAAAARAGQTQGKIVADMTSRFVGLIVVPGEHIKRIELEEFDPSAIT